MTVFFLCLSPLSLFSAEVEEVPRVFVTVGGASVAIIDRLTFDALPPLLLPLLFLLFSLMLELRADGTLLAVSIGDFRMRESRARGRAG